MQIEIPHKVQKIINIFHKNGFEAYAVGGCIRDSLLGTAPYDWDITTNAQTDKIKSCFEGFHIIETGIKHGTVTLVMDNEQFEITTYRLDGEYTDHRRPDDVIFTTDIYEDLARRDFTINAIACNGNEIIDNFNGIQDIKNKIIRCVGNPDKRFNEDALRILRALRFSAVLNFKIEANTAESIHKNYKLLKNVSSERIFAELKKMLCGTDIYQVLINFADVFSFIIPEVEPCLNFNQNTPHHNRTLWGHIATSVDNIEPNAELRFAMLLHDLGKPLVMTTDKNGISRFIGHNEKSFEIAQKVLKNLRCSNNFIQTVSVLVLEHDRIFANKKSIKKFLGKYSEQTFLQILKIREADILAQSDYMRDKKLQNLQNARENYAQIIAEDNCFKLSDLKINGDDLIKIGITDGKTIGKVLRELLEMVISEQIPNSRQELLDTAKVILGALN